MTTENNDKIKEIFMNHKNRLPEDVKVQFGYCDCYEKLHVICMNIDALWQDWFDKCRYCPENDATIHSLWIISGKNFITVDAVTSDLLEEFTFEEMMHIIDKVW